MNYNKISHVGLLAVAHCLPSLAHGGGGCMSRVWVNMHDRAVNYNNAFVVESLTVQEH